MTYIVKVTYKKVVDLTPEEEEFIERFIPFNMEDGSSIDGSPLYYFDYPYVKDWIASLSGDGSITFLTFEQKTILDGLIKKIQSVEGEEFNFDGFIDG